MRWIRVARRAPASRSNQIDTTGYDLARKLDAPGGAKDAATLRRNCATSVV